MENRNFKKTDQELEEKKGKKKWLVLILLLLLVIGLVITFRFKNDPKVIESISKIPGINNFVNTESLDVNDQQ